MANMIKTYTLELTEFECKTLNDLLGHMTDIEMEKATINTGAKREALHDIYGETLTDNED